MNKYSKKSRKQLNSCHPDLRLIFETVLPLFDHSVIEGHRPRARQKELFDQGKSKIDGFTRKGKHNYFPSMAVDVAPWPVDWQDRERFFYLAGIVKAVSEMLYTMGQISHHVRWGGDWDGDTDFDDQTFDDLVHFELITPRE